MKCEFCQTDVVETVDIIMGRLNFTICIACKDDILAKRKLSHTDQLVFIISELQCIRSYSHTDGSVYNYLTKLIAKAQEFLT